jgi:hypothetical protein
MKNHYEESSYQSYVEVEDFIGLADILFQD